MKTLKSAAFFLFVAAGLSGCVRTQATMLSSQRYAPVDPKDVVIYLSAADIPRAFEKIAIINAQGSTGFTNENQMYEAVRKKAAKVGANGVLIQRIEEPDEALQVVAAVLGTDTERRGRMFAIRVAPESEQ